MLTPSQKGSIAESAIVHAAIKLGIQVFKPVNEGLRYDLIFAMKGGFVRVQCKWAAKREEVVVVTCLSNRRGPDGFIRLPYTADQIDAYAAYCAEVDRCYFIPFEAFPQHRVIQLRLGPTHNNQQRRINWAEAYEFGATLGVPGAVAQLGERERGTLEAAGSSPAGST